MRKRPRTRWKRPPIGCWTGRARKRSPRRSSGTAKRCARSHQTITQLHCTWESMATHKTPVSVATGDQTWARAPKPKTKPCTNSCIKSKSKEIERCRELSRAVGSCRELSAAVAARCSLREQRERAPAANTVHSSQNGTRTRAGKVTARAIARSPALLGCTVLLYWWCHVHDRATVRAPLESPIERSQTSMQMQNIDFPNLQQPSSRFCDPPPSRTQLDEEPQQAMAAARAGV